MNGKMNILIAAGCLLAASWVGAEEPTVNETGVTPPTEDAFAAPAPAEAAPVAAPAEEPKKDETVKEEVKKEEPKKDESAVPDWVKRIELKGDFRLRYNYQNFEDKVKDDTLERNRLRYRARIGLTAKLVNQVKVNFGIASGSYESKITKDQLAGGSDVKAALGQDVRSTNQTFDDFFSHKPLWIDYAYAEYSPWSWLTLLGGKMKNPFYTTSELMWDADITPEGAALTVNYKVIDQLTLFANAGILVLDEVKALDDPLLAVVQVGAAVKVSDFDLKAALAFYDPMFLANADSNTDNGTAVKNYIKQGYYWKDITAALEANYTIKEKYSVGLFGEVMANLYDLNKTALGDKADETVGFLVGVKGGSKAMKDLGDVQGSLTYRQTGIAAWIPFFVDSDFFDGNINSEGIKLDLKAGLYKNFFAGANLLYAWTKNADFNSGKTNRDIQLQLDLNYKF